MKRLLAALIGALLLIGWYFPAMAADLYTKAPPQTYTLAAPWSGFYISGYGLYGANLTNTDTNTVMTTGAVASNDPLNLASAPHGPGLGGSIGYNFQPSQNGVVFGVRGDIAYANMQGGGAATNTLSAAGRSANAFDLRASNATNYLGDLDVILGIPLSADGRLLAYAGGGFAFGGAKPNLQFANLQAAASDTSTGWNGLVGLAYQFTPNWSVFMEGDYFQLGDKSLNLAGTNGTTDVVATSLTKYHIFEQKVGLTFKF